MFSGFVFDPSMDSERQYVHWFRNSAPYINAHRGETFVIQFGGEAVSDPIFPSLIHDLALLDSLGVKLVVVHGARPQIETGLQAEGLSLQYRDGLRITDQASMEVVKRAAGHVRFEVEALLSMGLANSPMAGARIRTTSGNFVLAKPMGIRDGIDYLHTGEVRRVDAQSINQHLALGEIVIISPVGFSPTGEMFNLAAEDVATAIAIELRASKLLLLVESDGLIHTGDDLIRELTLDAAKHQLAEQRQTQGNESYRHLFNAIHACRNGVRRTQIIDRRIDGALISELFTRDGIGTMVSADLYDDTRNATIDDIGGILELIEPLEEDGTLVRRSREKLETEIERFVVMERDGAVIGCAALYPLNHDGDVELACVAVHNEYQDAGRGERLMDMVERQARSNGARRLFVLTTRTTHWFREFGFESDSVDNLPADRKALYNYQRGSKVLVKTLT